MILFLFWKLVLIVVAVVFYRKDRNHSNCESSPVFEKGRTIVLQVCTSRTSSICTTWELVRKANSQALSQVTWIRNSKSRAQKSIFQQALQVTPNSLKYRLSSKNQWHRILFLAGGFHGILPSNIRSSNFLAIHIWETVGYTNKFFTQNFSDPLIYERCEPPEGIHSA